MKCLYHTTVKCLINNLSFPLKNPEEKNMQLDTKPAEKIQIRAEINETQQKNINKVKS